jgi:hypothetical protein
LFDQEQQTRKFPYDVPELEKDDVDVVLIANTYHYIDDRAA